MSALQKNANLNTGPGRCSIDVELEISPTEDVIEVGAVKDVRERVFAAVHHYNRNASTDDFVAISLPEIEMGYSRLQPGNRIVLFGSKGAIAAVQETSMFVTLKRRGMIKVQSDEVDLDAGETGKAFVRDRTRERLTASARKRQQKRRVSRGTNKHDFQGQPDTADFRSFTTVTMNGRPLNIREVEGGVITREVMVSTYGFSRPSAPAFLPAF